MLFELIIASKLVWFNHFVQLTQLAQKSTPKFRQPSPPPSQVEPVLNSRLATPPSVKWVVPTPHILQQGFADLLPRSHDQVQHQ